MIFTHSRQMRGELEEVGDCGREENVSPLVFPLSQASVREEMKKCQSTDSRVNYLARREKRRPEKNEENFAYQV